MANKPPEDKFSTKGPLWIMILSLSILFSAILSSYLRYDKTISDYQAVSRTTQDMRSVSELKNVLRDNSLRTYLFTGEKKYLVDLQEGYNKSVRQLNLIDSLLSGDSLQQRRCDTIRAVMQKRFILLNELVQAKQLNDDSLIRVDVILSRDFMDDLISRINAINDYQERLLSARMAMAAQGDRLSPVFLLIASAISSFFIVITYLMMIGAFQRSVTLQSELAHKVKELNRSNSELEQFAYVASHDLQEPLRKLRTFGNMLQIKEKERLSAEGNELIERMQSFGTRMQRLIEDLLTFSRMINGEKQSAPVDLNRIITDIKANIGEVKENKQVIIQSATLPVINGYESQLNQLFQNLISNSIKYSKINEAVKININSEIASAAFIPNALDKDSRSLFYKISITDNGIGFQNEYSEKIFNIFQRLHGKGEYEGTGIGLAICKRVVENHNGYISATGQPGVGAVVNIYLPKN